MFTTRRGQAPRTDANFSALLENPNHESRKAGGEKTWRGRGRGRGSGPILMQVTRRPQDLRTTPTLLAVTPLPRPLTTPPVISTYLVAGRPSSVAVAAAAMVGGKGRAREVGLAWTEYIPGE
jgi:hypothetical protein